MDGQKSLVLPLKRSASRSHLAALWNNSITVPTSSTQADGLTQEDDFRKQLGAPLIACLEHSIEIKGRPARKATHKHKNAVPKLAAIKAVWGM